jgi:sarcosine oxidase gamma subunit
MATDEFNAGPVPVRKLEPLVVIALRYLPELPEARDALMKALLAVGITASPEPGELLGQDPWAIWRSPSEVILLGTHSEHTDAALAALADAKLACAVDQSDGVLALELQGPQLDDLMLRLVDSGSLPILPGTAVRVRLADISVTLIRHMPHRIWLLAERPYAHYLIDWLNYAGAGLKP